VNINRATSFKHLSAYQAVYRVVVQIRDWDERVPYISSQELSTLQSLRVEDIKNQW